MGKKILWVSRHIPSQEQIDELDKLGFSEIVVHKQRVDTAEKVVSLMRKKKADDVMVVCPWDMLKDLLTLGIKPIKSVMKNKARFVRFERIVEIKTEDVV